MSRLKSELVGIVEVAGTTGHVIGHASIEDGKVRRVYRLRLQQRGATLGNVYFHRNLGATLGATIDRFKFDVPNQIIDVNAIDDSLPLWPDIDRATYDSIFVSVEVASVDIFILYADENKYEYRN